jgi:hypothetical protein
VTGVTAVAASATERLLLACSRPDRSDGTGLEADVRTTAADPDVDWDAFTELALWHRLAGVAAVALRSAGVGEPSAVQRLAAAYTETCARNLATLAELASVARRFEAAGIRAGLLKGAALLHTVYDDPGTRPMYDIDLLVPEDDAPRADAALRAAGYTPAPQFAAMADELWRDHARWVPLVRDDGLVVVEMHRRLGGDRSVLGFPADGMWERSRPSRYPMLRVPSAEDLLVHVCLHALGDRRLRSEGALGQLRDVGTVVARCDLDWDRVASEAEEHGFGPALALVLAVAEAVLHVAVPADALPRLAPEGVDARLVAELVRRRVLRDRPWRTLERLGPRTTALRQLLPPRPARVRSVAPYAAWATAAARIVARDRGRDLRREVDVDRAVQALITR